MKSILHKLLYPIGVSLGGGNSTKYNFVFWTSITLQIYFRIKTKFVLSLLIFSIKINSNEINHLLVSCNKTIW